MGSKIMTEHTPEQKTFKQKALASFFELVHVVVISVAIIVPVRYFLIQPFYVKGASMEPNFHDHEYLIIDEISFRFREPKRGEIVVFRYPLDHRQFFIKRIIGLPGERIKVSAGRVIVYNNEHPQGQALDESSYLSVYTRGDKDIQLGNSEYFLLGDNRDASLDSRVFGPVNESALIGRVWLRGWPLDKLQAF